MTRFLGILFVCLCTGALASPFKVPTPEPYFTAISPIFGYDPAYGTLAGVAWFQYPSGEVADAKTRQELMLVMRFGPHGTLSYHRNKPESFNNLGLDFSIGINNFYSYDTVDNSSEIDSTYDQLSLKGEVKLELPFDDRWKGYTGINGQWQEDEREPTTQSAVWLVGSTWDARNDSLNARSGHFFRTQLNLQPSFMTSESTDSLSAQLATDGRWYFPIGDQSTVAVHALAEASVGEGLQSSVGGSELLRGYLGGQFTSQHLLAGQAEYRFPVWHFIKGVAFVDAANLINSDKTEYYSAVGAGLRFGVPPDQSMSVRLDVAVNDQGEMQMYVNFNQVF
jgi:outer membrane protein assembly factor BamA